MVPLPTLGRNSGIRRMTSKENSDHKENTETKDMESKGDRKGIVRRRILAVRDGMSDEDRRGFDAKIRKFVLTRQAYKEAQVILAYASYRSEVDTTALIRQALADKKAVFVPKVSGEEMEFWQISGLEDLRKGYRGIPEPAESISFPAWAVQKLHSENISIQDDIDLDTGADKDGARICRGMMWMPGAVFDRQRHRIGYGKGFYDRYLYGLENLKETLRGSHGQLHMTLTALAYHSQILEEIPYEPHDIRPDMIITENGIS